MSAATQPSRAAVATSNETNALGLTLDAVNGAISAHEQASFADTHGTLLGIEEPYNDANGTLVGDIKLVVTVDGVDYWIPGRIA